MTDLKIGEIDIDIGQKDELILILTKSGIPLKPELMDESISYITGIVHVKNGNDTQETLLIFGGLGYCVYE